MLTVVYMLASYSWCNGLGNLCSTDFTSVLELCLLGGKLLLDEIIVAMFDLTMLGLGKVVRVHLRQNLTITDRLNACVVVILVNLTIDSLAGFILLNWGDMLLLNSRVDGFVDLLDFSSTNCSRTREGKLETYGGVMFTILVEKGGDCCLGFIHCCWC